MRERSSGNEGGIGMSNLQIFKNQKFGEIRTIEEDGKILFVAIDIAKPLRYKDTNNAIKQHCRWVVKRHLPHPQNPDKTIEVNMIPEGDIYRLVASSELPSAVEFESLIFDEILPSIRKHGAYMTPEKIEEVLLNPDTIIRLATDLKTERETRVILEAKVEEDKPKVIFADSVVASKDSILVREMAKVLKQNGVDTGEKRLYQYLRENGYLIRKHGDDYNSPTQRSMRLELFEVQKTSIGHSDGTITIKSTPKVTGKGQIYFVNKLTGFSNKNLVLVK
jgi:anti-repressor protein